MLLHASIIHKHGTAREQSKHYTSGCTEHLDTHAFGNAAEHKDMSVEYPLLRKSCKSTFFAGFL